MKDVDTKTKEEKVIEEKNLKNNRNHARCPCSNNRSITHLSRDNTSICIWR